MIRTKKPTEVKKPNGFIKQFLISGWKGMIVGILIYLLMFILSKVIN